MAQHQAGLCRGTAAHHVLVGTTDVGGHHTQDDSVFNLPAARVLHFRIVNTLHFDLASAEIHHTTIARHAFTSLLFLWNRVAQAGSALSARVIACVFCVACKGLIASKLAPTVDRGDRRFCRQLKTLWERACSRWRFKERPYDWRSKTLFFQCDTPPPGPGSALRYPAPWRSNLPGNDCGPQPPRPGQ
ncbi:hypothetical protein D3C86_1632400 [compost metagenome]